MKTTQRELSQVQELCNIEDLNSKKYELLASLVKDENSDLKDIFLVEAKRHKDNICRLMKYIK